MKIKFMRALAITKAAIEGQGRNIHDEGGFDYAKARNHLLPWWRKFITYCAGA